MHTFLASALETVLAPEVKALRQDLARVAAALERVAAAVELQNAHQWPQVSQPNPDVPAVEVSYVDTLEQAELLDIEVRLTHARGLPPTEEEILAEYQRRHPPAEEGG